VPQRSQEEQPPDPQRETEEKEKENIQEPDSTHTNYTTRRRKRTEDNSLRNSDETTPEESTTDSLHATPHTSQNVQEKEETPDTSEEQSLSGETFSWRRAKRVFKTYVTPRRVILLLLLCVNITMAVATGLFLLYTNNTLPQSQGTLLLPGLRAPVSIERESNGILHIIADNFDDLFFAQGVVCITSSLAYWTDPNPSLPPPLTTTGHSTRETLAVRLSTNNRARRTSRAYRSRRPRSR